MNEVVSQTAESESPIWAKDHEYDTPQLTEGKSKSSLNSLQQPTDQTDVSAFSAFDTQQRARSFPRVSVVLNRGDISTTSTGYNGEAPVESELKSELLEKYLIQEISAISSQGKSILNKIGMLMNNKTDQESEVDNQVVKFEKERVLSEYFKYLSKHSDVKQMKNVRSIIVLIDKDNLVSLIEDDSTTKDPQQKFFKQGSYDDMLKRSQRLTEELNEKFRLTKLQQKPTRKLSIQDRKRLASTMKPKTASCSSTTSFWKKNREKRRVSTVEGRGKQEIFEERSKSRPKIVYKITHKAKEDSGKSQTSLKSKMEVKHLGQGEVYEDGYSKEDDSSTTVPQYPPPPPIPICPPVEERRQKFRLKTKPDTKEPTKKKSVCSTQGSACASVPPSVKTNPSTEKGCCLSDQDSVEMNRVKNTMESNVRSLKKLFESINKENNIRSTKDQMPLDTRRNWSERRAVGSSQREEDDDSVMRMIHNLLKTELSNAKAVSKDEERTLSSATDVFSCTPVCLGIKKNTEQKKATEPQTVDQPVEAISKPVTVTKATQKEDKAPKAKPSKNLDTGSFVSGTYMGPFNELNKNKITNLCPKNGNSVIQRIVEVQEKQTGKTMEDWELDKQEGIRKCSDFFSSMESLSLRDKDYILNHDPPKSKSVLSYGGRVRKRAKKKASVAKAVKEKIRAIEEGIKKVLSPEKSKGRADLKKKTENQEAVLKLLVNEDEIQDILKTMKTDKNKLAMPLKNMQLEKIPIDGGPIPPKSSDHSRCKAILWAFYAHHLKTIYHAVQNNKLEDPESVKSAQYITMYLKRSNKVKQLALLHLWSRIVRNSKVASPAN